MIFVQIPVPSTPSWMNWMQRAKDARDALIQQVKTGVRPEINRALYTEQKQLLLNAFHNKCAYCETSLSRMRGGDVEHFRPKLAVTDAQDNPVLIDTGTTKHPHPGYYWLAYDWDNLLPACIVCNQPSTGPAGESLGKRNRFPVKGNFWAHNPGDEHLERPLLLNPRKDDPCLHFMFESTGVIISLTEEAQNCIEIFDLNRDTLVSERKEAFERVVYIFRAFINAVTHGDVPAQRDHFARLSSIMSGAVPYAAFQRTAYSAQHSSLIQGLSSMPPPSQPPSNSNTPPGPPTSRTSGTP